MTSKVWLKVVAITALAATIASLILVDAAVSAAQHSYSSKKLRGFKTPLPAVARPTTNLNSRRAIRAATSTSIGQGGQHEGKTNGLNITYETKWFTQLVDHFTWANQDTWQQRYLVNTDHWCGKNCPILFYTGNEGDIEEFTNNTGWMWENADKLRAMLVFAEHRFYGKSFPYPLDPTKRSPNELGKLGYLSSEQAMADFARLIFELKNTIYDAKYSAVITVGGSYGGMLASWMRMKYSNLVDGALAASAPILQFEGEYDCETFSRISTKDFENYGANCSRSIAKSWSSLSALSAVSDGLTKISKIFNTCSAVTSKSANSLAELLSGIWVNMAMTDYANEASFLSKMPAYPIKHACAHLTQDPLAISDEQLLEGISKAMQIFTNYTGTSQCLDIDTSLNDPMSVMWDFQSCTEMVMPICSDGVNDMFYPQSFELDKIVRDCKKNWGVTTQVNKIRTMYGDKRMQSTSNIIFSSCERDPWSAGCPQESIESKEIYAIKIPGVVHHEDLRPSGPNDSDALKKVRQDELNIISKWISKHYEEIKKIAPGDSFEWIRGKQQNK